MSPRARVLLLALFGLLFVAVAESTLARAEAPASLKAVGGQQISLREGLTELAFGAAWCRPCEREAAGLRQRAGRYGGRGYRVVLVGVEARQSEGQFVEWARNAGVRGALVYDADGALETRLGAKSLPWFVVLDRSGRVLHSSELPPSDEQLRSWTSGSRR